MSGHSASVGLGFTGDVMLGRLIDGYVLAAPEGHPAEVWGDTLDLFAAVDARLINLECVIATAGRPDHGKIFRFRARPRAVDVLRAARIDFAGLANNHVLDFGPDALRECLGLLYAGGIVTAGAGENIAQASHPAALTAGGLEIAIVAVTDNDPGWEAGEQTPGVNYIAYDERGLIAPYLERMHDALAAARSTAPFVIVCAHVGPNWGSPSRPLQALAHQLLDLGADVYWGHSNHSFQGLELYDGRPILYSAGDFLDDYAVDPVERNDLSCFVEVHVQDARVRGVRLHPVRIEHLRVRRGGAGDTAWLAQRLNELSAPFGTRIIREDKVLVVVRAVS